MFIIRCIAFAVVGIQSAVALAAPRIDSISQRGLQQGATTALVVTGAELLPAPQVFLSRLPLDAKIKEGATPVRVEFEIALPDNQPPSGVSPGIRQLRIANELGISSPVAVVIDELAEAAWSPSVASWPVALSGTCDGATRLVTSLEGKQGQLLALEVEARRLGSALNAVIRVLDDQGSQFAWAQGDSRLDGDPRLAVTLPRDGRYQIELHDVLFQGQPPAFFRMKIANESAPAIPFLRAMNRAEIASRGLEPLLCEGVSAAGWHSLRRARPSAAPTGLLRMFVSDWREAVEDEDARLLGPLAAPVGINGRIGSPHESDTYTVTAAAGSTVRVQCIAERANSPLDGILTVLDSAGNQIAASDDQGGTVDPGLEFGMPSEPVTLVLRDLRHRGGDEYRYRLSVAPAELPSVKLTLDADRYLVPRNGVAIARVHVDRVGHDAPIQLDFAGLPPGVKAENAEIPAGATDALVMLRADNAAASGVLSVYGQAMQASPPLHAEAVGPASGVSRFSPWLGGELAVATMPPAPLALNWRNSSAGDALLLATNTPLEVDVQRAEGSAGPVRLSLVTTQVPPTKQENNQTVADVPRTLRMAQDVVVPADQNSATVPIAVPADLANMPYDLALTAELLSADGAQVLATVTSPSRRMSVARPSFTLELAEAGAIAPNAEGQFTVELRGKIVRPAGFVQPVTVVVVGLPESIAMPVAVVPEGQSEFTLGATFPATLSLGELRNAKVTATSELAPGLTLAAANELPLELQVAAGGE